jgi:hypothetical protein
VSFLPRKLEGGYPSLSERVVRSAGQTSTSASIANTTTKGLITNVGNLPQSGSEIKREQTYANTSSPLLPRDSDPGILPPTLALPSTPSLKSKRSTLRQNRSTPRPANNDLGDGGYRPLHSQHTVGLFAYRFRTAHGAHLTCGKIQSLLILE